MLVVLGLGGTMLGWWGCGGSGTADPSAPFDSPDANGAGNSNRTTHEYIIPRIELNLNGAPCSPLDSVWQRDLINFLVGPENLEVPGCNALTTLHLKAYKQGSVTEILEATGKFGSCCERRHLERIPDGKRKPLFEMLQKIPCLQELPSDTLNFTTSGIVIAVVSDIDTEPIPE